MTSQEILEKFIAYYGKSGHKLIPNVSLVPEGDSTLLFVNSGMFPLVPYLTGEAHPLGKRLVNVQRSLRFGDMEEVGDPRHTIAFHMIGNWSLGDYFKKEQLPWVYDLLVNEFKLDPNRMYATVFEGDTNAPKDTESIELIKEIFAKFRLDAKEGERIFPCGKEKNWWQRGDAVGELGGPDSEIYYYLGSGDPVALGISPVTDEDNFLEIGNSVFMQYVRGETKWEPLPQKNVDFGGGLERLAMVIQGKKDIFETDNFWPIIEKVEELAGQKYGSTPETTRAMRIIADHIRAAVFLAMDGVEPSNKDQGYVLRRLLRRIIRFGRNLGITQNVTGSLVQVVADTMAWIYPQLQTKAKAIEFLFAEEEGKFSKTLDRGFREVAKIFADNSGLGARDWAQKAFDLYQSMGFPMESFADELKERAIKVDLNVFYSEYLKILGSHQAKSRSGAEAKFKGGLADHSEVVVKYHTATHLLQAALRELVGPNVVQIGSNITGERLRFDFPNSTKLTDETIRQVENWVNEKISKKLPVKFEMLPKDQAIKSGALYMKNETYPETVKVYFVGWSLDNAVSSEFCGGPHVENTSELGLLRIYKQEMLGSGKLRLYAKFE